MSNCSETPDPGPAAAVITVTICTADRGPRLADTLATLVAQDIPAHRREILVIDNSRDEPVATDLVAAFAHVSGMRWLQSSPHGLSEARNVALEACATPLIAYIDDDSHASPGWLRVLVDAFACLGADVVAAGGPVALEWDRPRPTWLPESALGYLSQLDLGTGERDLVSGEWLAGTNMAFRSEALRAIGGFRVDLGRVGTRALLGNEEVDVLRRLRARGGRVRYMPAAPITTAVDPTRLSQRWFRKRVAWQAVSDYLADPEGTAVEVGSAWRQVKRYLGGSGIRPSQWGGPSLRDLVRRVEIPAEFERQLRAVYLLSVLLLDGIERPEPS